MPFGMIGRTGPEMRQVVGFGDRSTGKSIFGGEFGARHCNQLGLYGVRVRQRRDAALLPNYFGQTCFFSRRVDDSGCFEVTDRNRRMTLGALCFCLAHNLVSRVSDDIVSDINSSDYSTHRDGGIHHRKF